MLYKHIIKSRWGRCRFSQLKEEKASDSLVTVRLGVSAYGSASGSAQGISNRDSILEPLVSMQNHRAGLGWGWGGGVIKVTTPRPTKPNQHSQAWKWELIFSQPWFNYSLVLNSFDHDSA